WPRPNTSSPTDTPVTPSPTSSTTPAASRPTNPVPSMGLPPDSAPEMVFQSIGLTLAARTAIRICPGPGCGSGASAHSRTSGPPYALYCNARIHYSSRTGGQPSLQGSAAQPASQLRLDRPRAVRPPDDATLLGSWSPATRGGAVSCSLGSWTPSAAPSLAGLAVAAHRPSPRTPGPHHGFASRISAQAGTALRPSPSSTRGPPASRPALNRHAVSY